ncbi:MAG TPA: amidohydrolase [Candidatus Polarisedimenticolia bacterium]|nr:amidohydrolase [Candidatus Polarisedimenticolia bacterium]
MPIHRRHVVPALILVLALGATLAAAAAPPARPPSTPAPKADLVLRHGAIYTLDAVRSWAEAVAVRGERIVYVGPDRGVAAYVGPKTRVVDLGGRMVLPAFQDSHIHPISGGISYSVTCALYDRHTLDGYLEAVAEYAKKHPDLPWIRGDGWTMDIFAPTGIPDRRFLDKVLPDRPVYLENSDGHSGWVNSKALQLAGITRETPDPPGGRIDRDPKTGEPIGGLQDSAMELVTGRIPPFTLTDRMNGLRYAQTMLHGYGITSFQDAAVTPDSFETYRALDQKGELTMRVVASQWWERSRGEEQIAGFLEARRKYGQGHVRANTVKIMQDGVMEVQTAALLKPYLGKPGVYGLTMVEPEALKRAVTHLDREGFQVHFHAIGDAAIRECLDAVEAARRANGTRDSRHHISHLELFDPADIPRFRELGVIANFQPLWAFSDEYMQKLTLPLLEPERARWIYPIGSLLRSGAVVAFGSDWSVSSANPLEEMEVAVTRMGDAGQTTTPFIPEERIDLPSALAGFTINAAYVNFQEDTSGSVETGKLADLIVLDRNLFAIKPEEISEAKVLLTLFGGKPVHGDFTLTGGGGTGMRR